MKTFCSPRFWLAGFILWSAALFTLSSFSKTMPEDVPVIPHIDKILHFGYFIGGAFIFATWILLRKGRAACLSRRILFPLLLFAVIGALDEWHQTFTPGRSGNDPFDWLADLLGALTGILMANGAHPLLLKLSRPVTEKTTIRHSQTPGSR